MAKTLAALCLTALSLAALSLATVSCTSTRVDESDPLGLRGDLVALPTRSEFAEIASLEEARRTGNGRLMELLREGDVPVRARAARALGRLPGDRFGKDVTLALCEAVGDPDAVVRAEAVRALGWRGEAGDEGDADGAAGVVARAWEDPDPAVRAALVDAAARLGGNDLARLVVKRLYDPVLAVRLEAIAAAARLTTEGQIAAEIDRELLAVLNPLRRRGAVGPPSEHEIWLTLYALGRRRSELGRGAFLEHDRDATPEARIFAIMGLARIRTSPEGVLSLERASADPDWRVAVEALRGLAQHANESSLPSVLAAIESKNAHVRRTACESLAAFASQGDKLRGGLQRGLKDRSASVRGAALQTMAKVWGEDGNYAGTVLKDVQRFAVEQDLVGRRSAAAACRDLPPEDAVPILERLLLDEQPFVSTAAIESLGEVATERALAKLREIVADDADNGRRLTAVAALRSHGSAADVDALAKAIENAVGDVGPELAWNAIENFRTIGAEGAGERGKEVLEANLRAQNPEVRRRAADVWRALYPDDDFPVVAPPTEAQRPIPLPGRDYPNWQRNPLVEVVTTRGRMVFELFPADAPLHVYSFVELASEGHYDGTLFHRVVPDFVVQGGDYRGDGNGGLDWRGTSLRHEFNTRKFLRGSLGMPRNEWFDSGGSQIFVTHRPTPHLDGDYTLFGKLVVGFEVLDAIEEGDRIVSTKVL
ncbi:MAG: HEAT repeat domain-containing protein [Planctomycetota bacterium]